jgi:hypothetical protein
LRISTKSERARSSGEENIYQRIVRIAIRIVKLNVCMLIIGPHESGERAMSGARERGKRETFSFTSFSDEIKSMGA